MVNGVRAFAPTWVTPHRLVAHSRAIGASHAQRLAAGRCEACGALATSLIHAASFKACAAAEG